MQRTDQPEKVGDEICGRIQGEQQDVGCLIGPNRLRRPNPFPSN